MTFHCGKHDTHKTPRGGEGQTSRGPISGGRNLLSFPMIDCGVNHQVVFCVRCLQGELSSRSRGLGSFAQRHGLIPWATLLLSDAIGAIRVLKT